VRKEGQWQKALALLDQMCEKDVTPDVITYSAAISACGNGGQWQQALALLDQMREKDVTADVITYNAAISACEKGGEVSESASLLKRGMEEGLFVGEFSIEKELDMLDLHGFPLDTANSLIRYFLDRKKRSIVAASPASKGTIGSKVVIVTGRGNHVNSDGRQGCCGKRWRCS
jgi:pentatricopeptide repeat protein